ncbi:TetR/AcrR family transcriptional regulator [Pseudomonas mosselii]|uniref:TetR/AcrR family transcriptional regulator n=1 Tax=Pseudomonas mosselii TaxID=78327 RepID=UPI00244BD6A6|nr:TetR family transcriptional regulator [Pseudomonas mosselii]MDH1657012.1 TetR/AcrR family transcriptional regulator [Pseudomonas mosselii]MDH1719515.1 TetR/AcrR family transcriptional regulator [Pseudomonas mosselii]MDH1724331.1 TetR/AcrR family transcriptional regulator [Pseudomonas mosselii]
MKVTKAQAQANRAHIVETASSLFRQRGYDGVGVAELMAAAGFTHGGFYKHFGSKADLMAEAAACGLSQNTSGTDGGGVADYLRQYLSREHRDNPASGCTLAALASDAARQPDAVKTVFADGLERLLAMLQAASEPTDAADEQAERARRLGVIATLVGAITLSRACPDDSPLADDILQACRDRLLTPQ